MGTLAYFSASVSAASTRGRLFLSCSLCVFVCSFILSSIEPRAHLAPVRATSSRCLSLIHGQWTASAAIPLPPFCKKKYSAYLPAPTALPLTDKLCRDPIFLWVSRILQKKSVGQHLHLLLSICFTKSPLVLDLGVPTHSHLCLFLSFACPQGFPVLPPCHKTIVQRPYGRTSVQITANFPLCVVFSFSLS